MVPWEELGVAEAPGGVTLRLKRRGAEYSIRVGTAELMNSRLSGSEVALARLPLAAVAAPRPRVLIGGLGMGFTLRAALEASPLAQITVAELLPEVVAWARGPMAPLFHGCLDETRVRVAVEDVAGPIREGGWDAILLDVDNGPEAFTTPANDALYGRAGLAAARAALNSGGVLAVWSAAPDAAFGRRMREAGFRVTEERVKADRGKRGARHVIWLGQVG
ncbi:hypothetical protein [Rubrimonas cliftonensis]|uniref:Spermidine synthase n=1 Tax=Rubrimonas cliftonensis TaxID=89524 RepID=A0A1H4A3I3_9RHOB|nr:hypothetical protein [Rubrimonas cliftonensis]SEA30348.1 hypothetical protein SAMN05444370_10446 [Rubrimonas cliftonensis]